MTLTIDLIPHVWEGQQAGAGLFLAASCQPGNALVLTWNTFFRHGSVNGNGNDRFPLQVPRVKSKCNTAEAESGRLWAQPVDTIQAMWGVADERGWSRSSVCRICLGF